MTKRKSKRTPLIDLDHVLNGPVKVKVGDKVQTMSPIEAEYEQLAMRAMNGDVQAGIQFVRLCIKEGLVARAQPDDDWDYRLIIPDDWSNEEWSANFDKYGPPPWPGERDGLTDEAREERAAKKRRRRRR